MLCFKTEENGVGPMPNQDKGHYLHNNEEISSRDYKVSASNVVKGLRDHPPSSYSLKMESFNTLLKSTFTEKYESRPFSVGGYNWTLVVYPNGNKKDSGSGYLSLYVAIDNSTLAAAHQEIYADLRFYIFNKNERKEVLSIDTFKDPRSGYLYDGDHCEFGVDVTIPSLYKISELFTVTENFHNPRFTWSIRGFSTLLKDSIRNIQVYPNGDATVDVS
ncbi:unnamed protein product [Arabidopsis halleri]